MADLIDDEAIESSESDSDEEIAESGRAARNKKNKKSRAAISDSSEEEDDDDEEAAEEMKDLINDEEEEEDDDDDDGSSSDGAAGTKRSHDSDEGDSSLEEDDLDLIQENLGVRLEKKKKFKRIRRVDDDDSEEDEPDEGRKIQRELFGQDELLESDEEDVQKPRSRPVEKDIDLDVSEEESDSEDDFIVDDNDQPLPRKTKKKGTRYADSAMQQAQEIFGVDFDYNDIQEDYDDFNEDGVYDDEEEYEDEDGEIRTRRKPRAGRKTIYDIYEPAELERSHLTAFDQEVRTKDEPERFQLRSMPVTSADEQEIKEEAEWIYRHAFHLTTITIQEQDKRPIAGSHFEPVKEEIEYALKFIRNDKLEVPYIAAYCREYVPNLCYQEDRTKDNTRDLWTVYNHDEQWCKLQSSKKTLLNLYRDMRVYLQTKPADPTLREIEDTDLERLQNATTLYELEDCRLHFKLYYSQLTTEMKLFTLEKKIQEQKEKREQRMKQREARSRRENGTSEQNGSTSARKETGDDDDDDQGPKSPSDRAERGDEDEEDEEDFDEEEEMGETEEQKLYKRLSKFKISSSRDRYQAARENLIGEFVKKFGLTPEQFGENLRDDYQKNSVVQHFTRPLDEAANHIKPGSRYTSKEDVIKAAKLMYSREISCDPLVRQTVRKYYFENAVINVKPTPAGLSVIDENHPCYTLKFLKNKPVFRLVKEQFLHLASAERDKLIEIKFSIEPTPDSKSQLSPYHESLKALFYSDFSSIVTKEWNELREDAIKSAMDLFLLPCLEKQLREKITKEAQDKIMKDCVAKLCNWINVAPMAPRPDLEQFEEFSSRLGTRICGFTFDPEGEAPCFATIIDGEGELIDHIRLPHLNIRKRHERMSAIERENYAKDRAKFKQFILSRKPHAVALAAETIQTKYICSLLAQILDELRENDGLPLIAINIVNNELASVYQNLKRANEEFPDFPPLLLQAVSLARKLNEPLNEYAKLCNPDNDILCLHFHPLQDDLPKEEFTDRLYQQFTSRVCAVGVDPNQVIAHPHITNIVQFLAGLGPRKGAHLLRSIKKSKTSGQLVSRQQLVKELGMTKNIFINCAGFIKLDADNLADEFPDEHTNLLDSTRIHPQSYGYAKKIAVDANTEGEEEGDVSDEAAADAIEAIFDHPEKLDDLDLNAFAEELQRIDSGIRKRATLQMIREEFSVRYKDNREPYEHPRQEEIFEILTKETSQTFYSGKLITCQVVGIPRKKPSPVQLDGANPVKVDETGLWRCPFCMRSDFQDLSVVWNHFDSQNCPGYAIGVKCKLDNGIFGFIPNKFISDREVADPATRVQIGQTIAARVMKVDTEKFSCDLTTRSSDLNDDGKKPQKDEYWDWDSERQAKQEQEARSKRAARKPYCKRIVVHPAFENIDCRVCEKKLAEREQGHAIIRPSSQGQNFLTLSWKVTDGIFQHVTIREENKLNAFSLGQQLHIDAESYEDLDEIIARYVQPMATYARDLLNYKYCIKLQDGVEEEDLMNNTLFQAKRAAPHTFPYRFCPSRKYPGKFLLGYMPKDKPKIECLTVMPRGYRFRKTAFKNLHLLIKWFKENWNWTSAMMSIHGSVPMSQ